jgi:hypothetical protein
LDENLLDFERNVMAEYGAQDYSPVITKQANFAAYNPYMFIYNWIKMELFDIRAMLETIA